MKKFKVKKIFASIKKIPVKDFWKSLRFLPKVCTRIEKILLLVFFGIFVISLGASFLYSWLHATKLSPQHGGVFREGIVGQAQDLDKHTARLLNVGLTKYDQNKNIIPDAAEKWSIEDSGRVYKFTLRPEFNSQDLATQVSARGIWQDIDITTPDSQTLVFTFKQPFSPFLNISTQPIFPYGPYKVIKEDKKEIELAFNENYYAKKPYLDKVILKLYDSQDALTKAFKHNDIDGYGMSIQEDPPKGFLRFDLELPRDLILFFNLSKKDLQDIKIRQALKENTKPKKELNLKLVTFDNPRNIELAQEMINRWSANGINVNLEVKDNVTLQKTIIPNRDYDLLLYGLDYGEDPDPYPFWHSSQVGPDGRNLSNFKNTQADKLLEQARLELNAKKRQDDYYNFQKILDSEIPMFVVEHQNYYYYTRESVYGIEYIVGTNEADRFLNVAFWYNETKRVKK